MGAKVTSLKFLSEGDYLIPRKRSLDYERFYNCANERAEDSPNINCIKCDFFARKPCRVKRVNSFNGIVELEINIECCGFFTGLTEDMFTDYFRIVERYKWKKL